MQTQTISKAIPPTQQTPAVEEAGVILTDEDGEGGEGCD